METDGTGKVQRILLMQHNVITDLKHITGWECEEVSRRAEAVSWKQWCCLMYGGRDRSRDGEATLQPVESNIRALSAVCSTRYIPRDLAITQSLYFHSLSSNQSSGLPNPVNTIISVFF